MYGVTSSASLLNVTGDVSARIELDIVDADGKYFGHNTATSSDVSGLNFTSQNFNTFDYAATLGALSAGFDYDTLAFSSGSSLLDLAGNATDGYTITLDDEIYYDATAQGFWSGGSVQPVYDLTLVI